MFSPRGHSQIYILYSIFQLAQSMIEYLAPAGRFCSNLLFVFFFWEMLKYRKPHQQLKIRNLDLEGGSWRGLYVL